MIAGVLCQKKAVVEHTKILLPLNYNTTFVDIAGGHSVTKHGTPALGNGDGYGHSRWSNGSLGTNIPATSYLTIDSTPTLDLSGQKPFTMECWIFGQPYGTNGSPMLSMRSGSGFCPIVMNFSNTKIGDSALASWQNTLTIQPSNQAWQHVAIVGDGTNITIYRGGTSIAQVPHPDWPVGDRFLNIGQDVEANAWCYFNDFRFSDIARYTANFTPPTSAFTFGKPIERWFRFDNKLSNSGDLATTANITSGSVTYSSSNMNYSVSGSGSSLLANGTQIITLSPTVTLGADFYVQFYAAWPDDSNFNTVINSESGFNISKNASGNFYANFVTGGELTSAATYKDGVKRKFKLTFKAGVLQLYVNDVLTDTSTSVMTSVPFGVISLFYGTGGAATNGYYDDLIIHRNVIP